MKVAVIGAGWAGLSAALRLQADGHQITLFEAAPAIGGRARGVPLRKLGLTLDNGQHILLSAYTETLALLQTLHGGLQAHCATLPLAWETADASLSLRVPKGWPSRLALAWGLARARGLSLHARGRAALALMHLARTRWQVDAGLTVEQWLDAARQPTVLRERFWRPLCLATMNTPPAQACAQLFAHVLRDSLGRGASACRIVLPRVDLGSLWDSPALRRMDLRLRHPVRQLEAATADRPDVCVDGEAFDAAIIAAPAAVTHRLLRRLPPSAAGARYLAPFAAFSHLPIATLYLRLAAAWPLPRPMLQLQEDQQQRWFGQWVFDRAAFCLQDGAPVLSVVISDARCLDGHDETAVVNGVLAQLRAQLGRAGPMPAVEGHQLIVEKRATFAALPGLARPQAKTPWTGVFVAGDWTDTGYPAVLEGAVRSGLQAARLATARSD